MQHEQHQTTNPADQQQPYPGAPQQPQQPYTGMPNNPYGAAPNPQMPQDDIGIIQSKLTAILRCDMSTAGRLLDLIAKRGQMAYQMLNSLHNMSPQDRAAMRTEIMRLEAQIAQLLAL